jgi:hypothetical protein
MGISNKLNEGLIYRFLKTAIKMRRLQKRGSIGREIMDTQNLFDEQLELTLKNVDEVDTERVIQKTGTLEH